MKYISSNLPIALLLLAISLCFTSCTEEVVQVEKTHIQFQLTPSSNTHSVGKLELPDNALARITITNSNNSPIFEEREVTIRKVDNVYVTEPLEISAGNYQITDLLVIHDSLELFLTPKQGSEMASSFSDVLPRTFSIDGINSSAIAVAVADIANEDIRKFGYTSIRSSAKSNSISIALHNKGRTETATAELRQNNKLLKSLTVSASANTLALEGDTNIPYSLTVYTSNSAATKIFTVKELKKENGKNTLHVELQPALVLSIESYVDAGNEYEEYFDFRMDGKGAVNINWGDGQQTAATLPLEISHEYLNGNYKAIITGDISRVTDFAGFSYSSIITAITGLTNLTSLQVYDPSWGAVPIKVDLSNCKKLETINIAKYGAPYEPANLITDFKLPTRHFISTFIFDAPSFDISREYISKAELDAMINNVYNNAVSRGLHNGKFFVNPTELPTGASAQKLEVLKNQYGWEVGFNDEIYNAYDLASGRSKITDDSNAKREKWLKGRFTNSDKIIKRGHAVATLNY